MIIFGIIWVVCGLLESLLFISASGLALVERKQTKRRKEDAKRTEEFIEADMHRFYTRHHQKHGSAKIKREEAEGLLKEAHRIRAYPFDETHLEKMFSECDPGETGRISYSDFMKYFEAFSVAEGKLQSKTLHTKAGRRLTGKSKIRVWVRAAIDACDTSIQWKNDFSPRT
eukprot:SAG31_NODE_3150_length_4617_cov_23.083001_6_plen_170_part_01